MGIKSSLFTGATAWLYYRSAWALPALLPVWIWYYRGLQKECICKKQQEFLTQFKEMIQSVSASLNTGYSIENAIRICQRELQVLYEENALIMQELQLIIRQLKVQIAVEQVMEDMAYRTGLEDVESFAAVFVAAKRSGGDMMAIIQNTSRQIADKIDVKREIDTMLASKKYEFRIMSVVPYVMIGYMLLSFPEFMSCLYGNMMGAGVMTICFGIYMTAYYIGAKLIEIDV